MDAEKRRFNQRLRRRGYSFLIPYGGRGTKPYGDPDRKSLLMPLHEVARRTGLSERCVQYTSARALHKLTAMGKPGRLALEDMAAVAAARRRGDDEREAVAWRYQRPIAPDSSSLLRAVSAECQSWVRELWVTRRNRTMKCSVPKDGLKAASQVPGAVVGVGAAGGGRS